MRRHQLDQAVDAEFGVDRLLQALHQRGERPGIGLPALHHQHRDFAAILTRDGESGGKVHSYFCPNCGSTIYWKADKLPSLIGVAVGALADPKYPAPVRSIFERSKHDWVQMNDAVECFQQSSAAKNSS